MSKKENRFANTELTKSAGEVMDFIESFAEHDRGAIMIHGGPGVGKSAVVSQLVKRLGLSGMTDLRLATLDTTVVGGIPARHPTEPNRMTMLYPDFYPSEENHCLFLDEFSNCPPAMQNVALQLLLDKKIHTHKLPESTLVIAAGNRQIDGCWTNKLSSAAANRMKHVTLQPTWPDVRDFFKNDIDISQYIVSFLDSKSDLLYKIPADRNQMAFPTPRSWDSYGRALEAARKKGSLRRTTAEDLAVSMLGAECAVEFSMFLDLADRVSAEDVIEKGIIPALSVNEPSLIFAACGAVITYYLTKCGSKTNNLTAKHNEHLFDFLGKVPAEYQVKAFKDINWHSNRKHYESAVKHERKRFAEMSVDLRDILRGDIA